MVDPILVVPSPKKNAEKIVRFFASTSDLWMRRKKLIFYLFFCAESFLFFLLLLRFSCFHVWMGKNNIIIIKANSL